MAIQIPYTDGFITPEGGNNLESKSNKGQANGYAPLDANAKVPTANLPDQAALDAEVDAKITTHNSATTSVHGIANTANLSLVGHTHAISDVTNLQTTLNTKSPLAGVQWTARHTTSTGNQYVVGSIVYNAGRVYRCLATNDSIQPSQGGNAYWADLGVGYLLPNENPSILGGTISNFYGSTYDDTAGGQGGYIRQLGGNADNGLVQTGQEDNGDPIYGNVPQAGGDAGYIMQNGGKGGNYGNGGSAGYIITDAYDGNSGGSINTGAGEDGNGGGINLSNNGGSIQMYGTGGSKGGSISTFRGGGSIDTRGKGSIEFGLQGQRTTLNGSASGSDKTITLPNATGTIALTSDSRFTDARTPTSHAHGNITNAGAVGSTENLPLITTTSGVVTTGLFGTTANSFCQGNDARLSSPFVITMGHSSGSFTTSNQIGYVGNYSDSSLSGFSNNASGRSFVVPFSTKIVGVGVTMYFQTGQPANTNDPRQAFLLYEICEKPSADSDSLAANGSTSPLSATLISANINNAPNAKAYSKYANNLNISLTAGKDYVIRMTGGTFTTYPTSFRSVIMLWMN